MECKGLANMLGETWLCITFRAVKTWTNRKKNEAAVVGEAPVKHAGEGAGKIPLNSWQFAIRYIITVHSNLKNQRSSKSIFSNCAINASQSYFYLLLFQPATDSHAVIWS